MFQSVASIWEIQIKETLGKIKFDKPIESIFKKLKTQLDIEFIPIKANHIFALNKLPLFHKYPFDRILATQTIYEKTHLMTSDKIFSNYPVKTIW